MDSALFSPLQIGPVEVPNRIAISPMCMYSAEDGSATDFHLQHALRFAMSGAGLAVLEATAVERRGRISHGCLGLYSDHNEQALARVVAAAKKYALPGFKLGIQLSHAGRKGSTPLSWERVGTVLTPANGAWETVAPSAIPFGEKDWPVPHELSHAEILGLIDAFADATARAARIGFDVIELHGAHGYLVHEFHSPLSNKRTDHWGGDAERRLNFPLAVAEAMRAVTPSHVALGARITGTDFIDNALGVEDAVRLSQQLKQRGFHYVCISSGNIVAGGRPAAGPGFNVERAARVKTEAGLVTRTVGYIAGPQQAEAIIASGAVDQVALARAFLDDPNWGLHAAEALGVKVATPNQYIRVAQGTWPAAKDSRAFA
ncbi:MAG: NADH:flavin oxidoreductase/NADH oxidase [Hyphomicrobiales bacterium]|jgi:2,4-dienoyl-CoA reductase-like NADH-dependent reductase (Old Yellow Enzyme family)|nr:NADH:flavin oxidoreductase/NADH oxidase [Hyphomicrobiales bacterium]